MNKKYLILLIAIILVPGCDNKVDDTEIIADKEQNCINSGGKVSTTTCYCPSTDDFPDFCVVGVCSCPPYEEFKREIKACDCGPERCFDGNECRLLRSYE